MSFVPSPVHDSKTGKQGNPQVDIQLRDMSSILTDDAVSPASFACTLHCAALCSEATLLLWKKFARPVKAGGLAAVPGGRVQVSHESSCCISCRNIVAVLDRGSQEGVKPEGEACD